MSSRRRDPTGIGSLLVFGAFVGVVCGAAGYLVQSSRNEEPPVATASSDRGFFAASGGGFDIRTGPAAMPAPPRPVPASSPLPVYSPPPVAPSLPAASATPTAPVAPASAAAAAAPPAAERAARADARWTELLAQPAAFMARRTHLGSPGKLQAFLADSRRWGGYVRHPLIATVLASPALVRALMTPAVVRGFIRSPAMNDRAAVRALAGSGLVRAISEAPGVRAAFADPAFLKPIYDDPEAADWLARNPEGTQLIASFSGLGAAAPR